MRKSTRGGYHSSHRALKMQLRPFFLPILIVLALFLSGAKAEIEVQQNPQRLTENRNDKQEYAQATGPLAQHSSLAANSRSSQPTHSDTGQNADDSDFFQFWRAISSQVFFNTLLTIATIFIAIFNYQLLFLARPILVADRPTPGYFTPKEWKQAREEGKVFLVTSAHCPFRNVGQSPAIVLRIIVQMKLGKDLNLPPNFDDCVETTAYKDKVVRVDAESDFYAIYKNNKFSDEEWKRIIDPAAQTKVLLYGQIYYRGAVWKKYVMNFGFVYEAPNSWFGPGNVFRFGRREYNTII
jgi:hypothetical protein